MVIDTTNDNLNDVQYNSYIPRSLNADDANQIIFVLKEVLNFLNKGMNKFCEYS